MLTLGSSWVETMSQSGIKPIWLVSFELRKISDGTTLTAYFCSGDRAYHDNTAAYSDGQETIAPASVAAVSNIGAEIDVKNRKLSLTDCQITMIDDSAIRDLIDSYYFCGKRATVYLGVHDMALSDFEKIGTYIIEEIAPSPGQIVFSCKDLSLLWRDHKITGSFASWHPLECIQLILEDCKTPAAAYDATTLWSELYPAIAHWCVSRTRIPGHSFDGFGADVANQISAPTSALKLINELLEICGGCFIPDQDGKYKYKHYDQNASSVRTWTDQDIGEFKQDQTWGNLVNVVEVRHAAIGKTTEETEFGAWIVSDEASLKNNALQDTTATPPDTRRERRDVITLAWCNGMGRIDVNGIKRLQTAKAHGQAIEVASTNWIVNSGGQHIQGLPVGHGLTAGQYVRFTTVTSSQSTSGDDVWTPIVFAGADYITIAEPAGGLGSGNSATEAGAVIMSTGSGHSLGRWVGKEGDQVFLHGAQVTGVCGTQADYHGWAQGAQPHAVMLGRAPSKTYPTYLEFWRPRVGALGISTSVAGTGITVSRAEEAEVMSFSACHHYLYNGFAAAYPNNFNYLGSHAAYQDITAVSNSLVNPAGDAYAEDRRSVFGPAIPRDQWHGTTAPNGWRDVPLAVAARTALDATTTPKYQGQRARGWHDRHYGCAQVLGLELYERGLYGSTAQDWAVFGSANTRAQTRARIRVIDRTIPIAMAERRLARFSSGCPVVTVTTNLSQFDLELGDAITLDDKIYINHGRGSQVSEVMIWEIVQKEIRIMDDTPVIAWKLAFLRWQTVPTALTAILTVTPVYTTKAPNAQATLQNPTPIFYTNGDGNLAPVWADDQTLVTGTPAPESATTWSRDGAYITEREN